MSLISENSIFGSIKTLLVTANVGTIFENVSLNQERK